MRQRSRLNRYEELYSYKTAIRLTPQMADEVKKLAQQQGLTMVEVIREAIAEKLEKANHPKVVGKM